MTNNAWNSNLPAEVGKGGTGATTLTDHGVLVGSGTSPVDALSVGTSGQVLVAATGADPAFATLTSAVGTINYTTGVNTLALDVNAGLQITTGFATWTGAGAYFDDTTLGTFQLLRGGTGYINSKPVSWIAQNIAGMTAGNTYWIYIDNTGTIGKTATRTDALFENNIVLFECLRDSTAVTNNQVTVKENHPFSHQVNVSNYEHDVIGTVIENINNGANITLVGTQGIGISGADCLEDHGLHTDIPDSGGAGVTWVRMFTLAGGKWARQNATNTFTGFYNNAGTATALTAGKFGVYRLYVSKDNLNTTTPVYFAVLDTAEYANLTAAQTSVANNTPAQISNELASLEMAQLGMIIYRESTATIVQVTIAKSTLRGSTSTGSVGTASLVTTVTTNFNNVLSAADTNVQAALDTLDDFGSGTGNQTVNLYTGAGVKAVTLGSLNTTSTTTIDTGTGALSLGAGATDHTTTLGSVTGVSATTIQAGTGALNIGANAVARATTLGNTTGASSLALKYGTADFTLASATGTVMSALDTGEITYPLQSAFLANNNANILNVTGDGTTYHAIFGTEIFDQNSDYDHTVGTFTAPVTARYNLCFLVVYQQAGVSTQCDSFIITSNRAYYITSMAPIGNLGGNGNFYQTASFFVDMDAADTAYISLASYGTTKTVDFGSETYFGGHLVC